MKIKNLRIALLSITTAMTLTMTGSAGKTKDLETSQSFLSKIVQEQMEENAVKGIIIEQNRNGNNKYMVTMFDSSNDYEIIELDTHNRPIRHFKHFSSFLFFRISYNRSI